VILDLMLPDIDGLEVCRRIRARGETPIIILSAREAEQVKVQALDLGADDYVTKPFGPEELLARVRAALRRSSAEGDAVGQLERGDLVIDFDKRRVVRDGDEIRLTPKEFDLLVYLARHAGRVLTHKAILRAIWGPHTVDQPEHLRVLVNAVRKKIEPDPAAPRYILTEPWVGYRFADDP
jgi:two-component system KDP operon response regulator KdpE